jgi:cytochrome P450
VAQFADWSERTIQLCLGAALARLEIATFFDQLRRRVAGMRLAPGTVVEMPNTFVYGLGQAMVDFDPA